MSHISRRGFARGFTASAVGAALAPVQLRGAGTPLATNSQTAEPQARWQPHLPGIWRMRLGKPEPATPVGMRTILPAIDRLEAMPPSGPVPLPPIRGYVSPRGYQLELPLTSGELMYGFGLQMYSVQHRGSKKTLRVNSDPKGDSGDAHAPVPFYVTTRGYGVLVDTARYASFYCGSAQWHKDHQAPADRPVYSEEPPLERYAGMAKVNVEIPIAQGVDVYLFGGPTMLQAIARYNLFAGGGVAPPEWGLGFHYRAYVHANSDQIVALANEFRERKIPCDVLGLEAGWQTHAYPCSFLWSADRFPNPSAMMRSLEMMKFKLNLWEHAYTHPSSPVYKELEPYAGDHDVWNGLVPDFAIEAARRIFGDHQKKAFVDRGVASFKLDECDNSDFTGGWAFPENCLFPSGLDGEQMHSLFGLRYQDTLREAFDRQGQPTYGLARSSGALAAPYPFVLYSDLYDHRIFIRALINSGFSGLLFCPEVRDAHGTEDLIRRLQSVVFSPLAMVNGWYAQYPPWKQIHASWETFHLREKNRGPVDPGWEQVEAQCREILNLRMQLIPYLLASFADYAEFGIPPFRALLVDSPQDNRLALIDDAYLFGDRLLVAPVFAGQTQREVVLPSGKWCDFWTGEPIEGGRTLVVNTTMDRIPVYVKSGAVFPMAEPGSHSLSRESRRLHVRIYGDGSLPFSLTRQRAVPIHISWDNETSKGTLTTVAGDENPFNVASWTVLPATGSDATRSGSADQKTVQRTIIN